MLLVLQGKLSMEINWEKVRHVHIVGIKGVAMTAFAIYCKERGMNITGSDVAEEFPTDELLARANIEVSVGFGSGYSTQKNKPDVVVYTGAHGGKSNPQVVEAQENNIPTIPHGIALGLIMEGKRQIVVAGSHGKTTTSAMIATILVKAKKDPSYAVGCGGITGLGAAGHFGKSDWFVAEGDEYVTDPGHDVTPRFLWTHPEVLVVSNIDFDHPDVYADLAAVEAAFTSLQHQQTESGVTVVNIDDPQSKVLLSGKHVITYGFSPRADVHITHVGAGAERSFFTLEQKGVALGEFVIHVPGKHNVSNATAAVVASLATGLSVEDIRAGLMAFEGTKRRFEKLGEYGGVTFYDDYAHHPTEIRATLAAAKQWFEGHRIIAVFQPHTYSRTKALLPEFARAFGDADQVIITDIYGSAREHDTLGISGQTLVSEIAKHHSSVLFAKDKTDVSTALANSIQSKDVVLFMGAGDIYIWEKEILGKLKK